MADPLQPHPSTPRTGLDAHQDAPVPEPHGDETSAADSPLAGRKDTTDYLPLHDVEHSDDLTADELNGETPD